LKRGSKNNINALEAKKIKQIYYNLVVINKTNDKTDKKDGSRKKKSLPKLH